MDEYISRKATVKAFCEKCKGYYDGHCIHRGECDVDVIQTAPAADVQPVKHGRWEVRTQKDGTTIGQHSVTYCSECGYVIFTKENSFCARCGARMDGESE